MNFNAFVAMFFCAMILAPIQVWGAQDSVSLAAPTRQSMILCPQMYVGSTQLNSTTQPVSWGNSKSCSGTSGGGVGGAVGFIGGAFTPDCPSSRPYLAGFDEGWGGAIIFGVGAYGAGMTATCCSTPQPVMNVTVGASPLGSASPVSTWVSGTYCP